MKIKIYLSLACLIVLAGCSNIRKYTTPDDENLLSGAGSIAVRGSAGLESTKDFEVINIDDLLKAYGLEKPKDIAKEADKKIYTYQRNDMQYNLIASSNQRCSAYLRVLTSSKAQTRVTWGGVATLLSGAAAVTTPAAAASLLAAGSTVANAWLSLYNEAYFNNLTLQVISAGITKQREAVLVNIEKNKKLDLIDYPVNRALADALNYHAKCNVVAGLEAAAAATNSITASELAKKSQ